MNDTPSKCWDCKKAANSGCAWSDRFEPVEGWKARWSEKGRQHSWHVDECPEFEPDADIEELNDYGVDLLCAEIVKTAGRDYNSACQMEAETRRRNPDILTWRKPFMAPWRRWIYVEPKPYMMEACEKFFTSEYALAITDGDPLYIMDRIRAHNGLEPWEDYTI